MCNVQFTEARPGGMIHYCQQLMGVVVFAKVQGPFVETTTPTSF